MRHSGHRRCARLRIKRRGQSILRCVCYFCRSRGPFLTVGLSYSEDDDSYTIPRQDSAREDLPVQRQDPLCLRVRTRIATGGRQACQIRPLYVYVVHRPTCASDPDGYVQTKHHPNVNSKSQIPKYETRRSSICNSPLPPFSISNSRTNP